MKFLRYTALSAFLFLAAASCEKKNENRWKIEVKNSVKSVEIVDISKDFYNPVIKLEDFKKNYPWFQGTVPDTDFEKRRHDPEEIKIYQEASSKISPASLQQGLSDLFAHIRYYFPQFRNPKIYLYSSALQSVKDPIFLRPDANMLFIDISAFLGEGNPHYSGLEQYFQTSMNPENILPKVSETFAEHLVPINQEKQKFLDKMVYQGKLMILQDAFLPATSDYLKINFSRKQYDWCAANEANIWNYFVENNLVFSADDTLAERFLAPGPFSKFYTEIDNQSAPQVGIFEGWQICRAFFEKKPDTKLTDFLRMDATQVFNESDYKPKK